MKDSRLQHECKMHLIKDSLYREKPYSSASYYKWLFKIECIQCHKTQIIVCDTERQARKTMSRYEEMPDFPK
jgi:hypothetical protein